MHFATGRTTHAAPARSTVTVTGFVLVPVLVAVMSITGDPSHSQFHHVSHRSSRTLSANPSTFGGGLTLTRTDTSTDTEVPDVTWPLIVPSSAPSSAVSSNTNVTESPGARPLGVEHTLQGRLRVDDHLLASR